MSRKITSDICFGLLTTILLTGGAWPQNAAAQSASGSFHQSGEWATHAPSTRQRRAQGDAFDELRRDEVPVSLRADLVNRQNVRMI